MALFVIGMVVSSGAYRVARVAGPEQRPSSLILIAGYVSTAGAFITGAVRAVSDITQIL